MTKPRLVRVAAALLALPLMACAAAPVAAPAPQPETVVETVSARDEEFRPETLRVPEGATVALTITNDSAEDHNLVRPDQGIDTGLIAPGAQATVTIPPPTRPTTFVCTLHNGMAITLVPT